MLLAEYIARSIVRYSRFRKISFQNRKRDFAEILAAPPNSIACYLIGVTTNGNLGDQAIAFSQLNFLKNETDFQVIEINGNQYWEVREALKKSVRKKDIIAIQGGGNLGNEYMGAEFYRRDLIHNFPDNTIISFPQTIYYSGDSIGRFEKKLSQKIYKKHKRLYLFAREKTSYEKIKETFPSALCYLVPDMVLYKPEYAAAETEPEGVSICLRNDCEGTISKEEREKIKDICKDFFKKVVVTDTVLTDPAEVDLKRRREMVEKKINEFAEAQLVITDRLHGMVLAAIAGTPCIVFNNYNWKVAGVYEWIKDDCEIKFVKQADGLPEAIKSMIGAERKKYHGDMLEGQFEPLINAFKECQ